MKTRLELDDTLEDILKKMCEANPAALRVMIDLVKRDPAVGLVDLFHMDDMGMRGPAIWVGFKDHCGEDLELFSEAIKNRDAAMVNTVRAAGYSVERGGVST